MFSKQTFQLVGDILKNAREESGLSQRDISQKLGYSSPQFISNIERGLCMPPLKQLKVMIGVYGLDPNKVSEIIVQAQSAFIREQLGLKAPKAARKKVSKSSKK